MAFCLVTGGAGYIGSHTCVALLEAGHDLLVLDDLSNSSPVALARVVELGGRPLAGFVEGDLRDQALLSRLFAEHNFDCVVHFAAAKAVGESVARPLHYYDNNLVGLLRLLEVMQSSRCRELVFSSSATVYGDPASVPIDETFPLSASNPYGWSKLMGEQILRDLAVADSDWHIVLLRYFNPVGAHVSGRIGEDPLGIPNNLLPYIAQVAIGRLAELSVYGGDYPTPDGTGVRDYIHVDDLARGHLHAVDRIDALRGVHTLNLGTGRGYSVLEMVRAFELASGRPIPYRIIARRAGDIASCWADPALAESVLGWRAEHDLSRMCADAWRWQSQNPYGYAEIDDGAVRLTDSAR